MKRPANMDPWEECARNREEDALRIRRLREAEHSARLARARYERHVVAFRLALVAVALAGLLAGWVLS